MIALLVPIAGTMALARVLPTMSQERFGTLPAYLYWHAAAYLTIDRSAYSPLLFSCFSIDVVPSLKAASAPQHRPYASKPY